MRKIECDEQPCPHAVQLQQELTVSHVSRISRTHLQNMFYSM